MSTHALRYLAVSLAVACLMAAIGAFAFSRANQQLAAARYDHQQARNQAQTTRQRYLDTVRDEQAIRATIARFDVLRKQGLIGNEDRLAWAYFLRTVETQRRLPRMVYELMPQRPLRRLDGGGDYTLHFSRMRLDLGLLHEGDLLRLLDDLQTRSDALIVPRSCNMQRNPGADRGAAITLDARCELDWITIRPPASPPR